MTKNRFEPRAPAPQRQRVLPLRKSTECPPTAAQWRSMASDLDKTADGRVHQDRFYRYLKGLAHYHRQQAVLTETGKPLLPRPTITTLLREVTATLAEQPQVQAQASREAENARRQLLRAQARQLKEHEG